MNSRQECLLILWYIYKQIEQYLTTISFIISVLLLLIPTYKYQARYNKLNIRYLIKIYNNFYLLN